MIDLVLNFWVRFMALLKFWRRRGHGISILIPFRDPGNDKYGKPSQRVKNLNWLFQYWQSQLPGAEIIIGRDPDLNLAFSKSVAVNDAVSRSKGDILVIADADCYLSADAVVHCAEEIRHARKKKRKLWFMPYRQFYRLTEQASQTLLASDLKNPHQFTVPPDATLVHQGTADTSVGHWFGAMVQILPREAFTEVGGWDPRFRGWGGEDHAAMRATDTLYWPHKTLPGQVLHVWHPMLSPTGAQNWVSWKERMWNGQATAGANDALSGRYYYASGVKSRMRALVDEGLKLIAVSKLPTAAPDPAQTSV